MKRPRRPTGPETIGVSAEERAALRRLAPLRRSLERLVAATYERSPGADPRFVESDVEQLWTVVLESYRLGIETVHLGLHHAEGLDHEIIDEAVEYGMRAMRALRAGR